MHYRSGMSRMSFLLALIVICLAAAWGQVTTATVYGTVTDATGGVIPGASVTLTHTSTGATSVAEATGSGDFQFDFLRVGAYTMSIRATGFKGFESKMDLTAGQSVRRSYALEVGAATETIQVESAAPLVNTVSAEQLQTFDAQKVIDLPLARRNVSALFPIGSGVATVEDRRYGGVRMNGVGMNGTSFSVDGTEASGNLEQNSPKTHQGGNLIDIMSIEAIQEVHTVKGILPAEYGGMVAGQVTILTRSGTNTVHGSLFENFQSASLNANDPFLTSKPRFTYNQFGGSVGGPVIKNRIFLFGTYEGYRESRFRALNADVPTLSHRNQVIAAQAAYKLPLDVIPLPNRPHDPNGRTGPYIFAGREFRTDNHVDVKGDYHLSSTKMLALTYSRGRPLNELPQYYLNNANDEHIKIYSERGTGSFVTSGASWTSETRFGFTINDSDQANIYINQRDPLNPNEQYQWGRRLSQIAPNLGWSSPASQNSILEGPTVNISEKFAKHSGSHSLKFGGGYVWRHGQRDKINNVVYNYTGLDDFLANIPSGITAAFGQGEYSARIYEFGAFVQDDWRIRPNLTLNFGLRYDFYSNLVAKEDKNSGSFFYNVGLLDSKFNVTPFRDVNSPYNHDKVNFAPRIGFNYNPDGHGKTVLRGGFAVMFSPQMLGSLWQGIQTKVIPRRAVFTRAEALQLGIKFPMYNDDIRKIVEQRAKDGFTNLFNIINPDLENPYTMHYTLGIQRELTPSLVLETAFVGLQGRKFFLWRWANEPDRQTGQRPNPNLAVSYYADQSQTLSYTSWQTSLRKRYSSNLSGSFHYTWGKSLSTGGGGDPGAYFHEGGATSVQDFFNVKADRGPSLGDITHYAAAEMIYELPRLANLNPFVRQAFGGWRVAGIYVGQTGQPLNITQSSALNVNRPDYVGGPAVLDNYNATRRYLNTAAFAKVPIVAASRATARPGTIGSGAVRAPGAWNVDFSLAKDFKLTEKAKLQIRTDMFNALNHVNLTGLVTSIDSSTFGQLRSTRGQRQIQLNGRIMW
jgi:outer membrane receptor protein involved in Fe transport